MIKAYAYLNFSSNTLAQKLYLGANNRQTKYTGKPEFTFLHLPKFVLASFYNYQRAAPNLQSYYHSIVSCTKNGPLDLIQLSVQTVNVRLFLL